MAKMFIQKVLSDKGDKGKLRRNLKVKKGKKIPEKKLEAASKGKYGKKIQQEANFAKTLKKLRKK